MENTTILSNMTELNVTVISNETTTSEALSQYLLESQQLQARINYAQLFICPTLLIVGVAGNAFTVMTVLHPQLRQLTTRYLLCALALSDTLALVTNPFNQYFMVHIGPRDPRALSNFGCKLFFVVYRTGKLTASWFIVGIAVERFVAVYFPLRVKEIMSKKNTCIFIGVVYVVVTTIISLWSFSTGIKGVICLSDLVPPGGLQRHKIHIILAAIVYTFAPFTVLLCITPLIIIKLIIRRKQQITLFNNASDRSANEMSRISLMLVVVIISWVIWIMPITVVLIHTLWTNEPIFGSTKKELIILQATAQFFEQINHSCNFIIYVMFSTQFRNRFLGIMKAHVCCCFFQKMSNTRSKKKAYIASVSTKVDSEVTVSTHVSSAELHSHE